MTTFIKCILTNPTMNRARRIYIKVGAVQLYTGFRSTRDYFLYNNISQDEK